MRSDWRLTIAERKRILLNNLYGVDIDKQAVEVTKLSLLLKVLEEESEENVLPAAQTFCRTGVPLPAPKYPVRKFARCTGLLYVQAGSPIQHGRAQARERI